MSAARARISLSDLGGASLASLIAELGSPLVLGYDARMIGVTPGDDGQWRISVANYLSDVYRWSP